MTNLGWPNRITVGRLLATPIFVIVAMHARYMPEWKELALGIFCVMAAGDVVDGFLARRLGRKTRLGAFLDPVADKAMLISAYVVLASGIYFDPPLLPDWLAVLVVSRDFFIVLGFVIIYMLKGEIFIEPSRVGKATTVLQVATVIAAFLSERVFAWAFTGLIGATAALTVVSGIDYFFQGIRKIDEGLVGG